MLENEDTEELEIITVNTFSDRTAQYKTVVWKAVLAIVVSAAFITTVIIIGVKNVKKTSKNEQPEEKTENKESDE